MSLYEKSQVLVNENHDELVTNHRAGWFHENIQIVTKKREELVSNLEKIAKETNEHYLASEAYKLMSTGQFEIEDRTSDLDFLRFMIDTARDNANQIAREDRQQNHFS